MNMSEKNSKIWLWVALSFVLGLVIGGCVIYFIPVKKAISSAGNISLYPPKANTVKDDWLVKIDGYAIRKSEFEQGYRMFLSQIPESQRLNLPNESVLKFQFLENLQAQYILTIKALESGIQNTEEGKFYIASAIRQAIYQLYLKNNLPKDENVFRPTKVEIEEYYNKNRVQFEKLGMKADQIKRYAEQDIYNRKVQEWIAQFVASKKEEFKLEKNKEALEKLGISSTLPQLNLQQNLPQK